MKKYNRIIAPVLLSAMLLSGCGGDDATEVSGQIQQGSITAVEVQEMVPDTINKELIYAGKVEANQTVSVTSKLSGQVEKINFDVGDRVNAGDVLFTLDKSDIQDQIKQLEASIKTANAGVNSAQLGLSQVNGGQAQNARLQLETAVKNASTGVDNAQVSVDNSKITVDNAKASLDDITNKYNDYKKLNDAGVISKSEFDAIDLSYTQAKNGYDQAVLGLNSANATLSQAQNSYNQAVEALRLYDEKITADNTATAENGVASAMASKEALEIQLGILRDTLNDTSVKAPISGVISEKNIDATNMVSASMAPFVIVDTSVVTVDVNVSEKIINLINVGQSVEVEIATIADEKITGIIKTVNPVADSTGTYPVSVQIANSNGAIKPGMFANVHFIEKQNTNTFVVPRNTIIENQTERFVYVVKDNTVTKVVVTTGIDNGEEIELLTGINEGDQVVVKGQSYLSDGAPVNVVTGEEA